MQDLHQNSFIEIQYDNENDWLYCNWQNYQTMESIQTGGELMIKYLQETRCDKVLNDNRLVKGSWTFAADWTQNVWFPRIIEAGLRHFAWIYSPDVLAKFSVYKAAQQHKDDVVNIFSDINQARAWLLSFKKN